MERTENEDAQKETKVEKSQGKNKDEEKQVKLYELARNEYEIR